MKQFIIILVFLVTTAINAQQEVILTKYTYNSMFFNPAYAGSHGLGEGTAFVHYRHQWIGLEGAPMTILAGTEMSLFDNSLGIGATIGRESIGVQSVSDIQLNGTYRIRLNKGFLAAGIKSGFSSMYNDFSKLTIADAGDIFDETDYRINSFNVGVGMYYNQDDFYVGFAVPVISRIVLNDVNPGERRRHYYMHTGLRMGDEYSSFQFEPSILLKYEQSVPLQFTLGMNVWLRDDFAVGGHYRLDDAVALSTEFHFMRNFRIAMAYDFTLSDIRHYSEGSMEILLGYRFNSQPNNPKVRNLRYGGRF